MLSSDAEDDNTGTGVLEFEDALDMQQVPMIVSAIGPHQDDVGGGFDGEGDDDGEEESVAAVGGSDAEAEVETLVDVEAEVDDMLAIHEAL
jgi:hypothetical protein